MLHWLKGRIDRKGCTGQGGQFGLFFHFWWDIHPTHTVCKKTLSHSLRNLLIVYCLPFHYVGKHNFNSIPIRGIIVMSLVRNIRAWINQHVNWSRERWKRGEEGRMMLLCHQKPVLALISSRTRTWQSDPIASSRHRMTGMFSEYDIPTTGQCTFRPAITRGN